MICFFSKCKWSRGILYLWPLLDFACYHPHWSTGLLMKCIFSSKKINVGFFLIQDKYKSDGVGKNLFSSCFYRYTYKSAKEIWPKPVFRECWHMPYYLNSWQTFKLWAQLNTKDLSTEVLIIRNKMSRERENKKRRYWFALSSWSTSISQSWQLKRVLIFITKTFRILEYSLLKETSAFSMNEKAFSAPLCRFHYTAYEQKSKGENNRKKQVHVFTWYMPHPKK